MTVLKCMFSPTSLTCQMVIRFLIVTGIVSAVCFFCQIKRSVAAEPKQYAVSLTAKAVGLEGTSAVSFLEQGKLAFRRGDFAEAAYDFQKSISLYNDKADQLNRYEALVLLAQLDHLNGRYRKALETLDEARVLAEELGNKQQLAVVENLIGNAHLGQGDEKSASKHLETAYAIANGSQDQGVAAMVLNNLGNLYSAQLKDAEALAAYRDSAKKAEYAGNILLSATAQINGATAAQRAGDLAEAIDLLAAGINQLQNIEDSYARTSNLINAGLCYVSLAKKMPQNEDLVWQAYDTFQDALADAERRADPRSASYAYGFLGKLYAEQGQLQEAQVLTEKAILSAQMQNTAESLYRWHWQNGRLLQQLGHIDKAIVSYRYAIGELQRIREEMASCYAAPERSYQTTASKVCAELVDILLHEASSSKNEADVQALLVEARDTLEVLKVYELREYFQDDCIDASRSVEKKLDQVSSKTAVFYPVVLPDRAELLVSFAGKLKRITIPVEVDVLTQEVREFRNKLVKRTTWEFLPHAQKLYDWLIRPLEIELEAMNTEVLVFVPGGPFGTVPMAALHDGHEFLISHYQIAVTPGLILTDPKPINQEGARLLSMGVTKAVQGFSGLPYVADELQGIGQFFNGKILLDEEFRLANMELELRKEPFSLVHIASHGQFGGDVKETFLLAYDEHFSMERFGEYVGLFRFRDEPLDLLVLSACETAAGDDRAALGLAGVAVRAGARSALATLWNVNDLGSYELIVEFYRQLRSPGISRAAALQAAQLKLVSDMRYEHPFYWAPFLLINNWL